MIRISLPPSWSECPLKTAVNFRSASLSDSTDPNYQFRYVDIGSVKREQGITGYQYMQFSEAPSRARKRVKVGDTIVSTVRTYLKAIALVNDDIDVIVSTGFAVLDPKLYEPRFLNYLVESSFFCDDISKRAWGIAYPAISEQLMGTIHVPVPPLFMQGEIANCLDAAIAKFNSISQLIENQLDVLQRYRASIIHEAVTRGLDPNAEMKPSGVDWIGDIPVGWKMNRLKYLTTFESGATPSKDVLDYWNGSIPWVSSMEVKADVIEDTSLHISEEAINTCSTRMLPAGTLVMVVRSGILQHTVPVAILGRTMTVNQDIKAMRFAEDMDSRYFFYFVRGNNDNLLKALLKDKSTVDNIDLEYLKSLILPVPSLEEQQTIIDYLEERCSVIDSIIDTKQKQLDILKRRRSSLIFEYVTGKRRVD